MDQIERPLIVGTKISVSSKELGIVEKISKNIFTGNFSVKVCGFENRNTKVYNFKLNRTIKIDGKTFLAGFVNVGYPPGFAHIIFYGLVLSVFGKFWGGLKDWQKEIVYIEIDPNKSSTEGLITLYGNFNRITLMPIADKIENIMFNKPGTSILASLATVHIMPASKDVISSSAE